MATSDPIQIRLLGRFDVLVDGQPIASDAWGRKSASALVKLLATAPSRELHREQVMEALWPDVSVDEAAPRLHTAAHYARRALNRRDAVVLRMDKAALLPAADVVVDVLDFRHAAEAALRAHDEDGAAEALTLYAGDLLPHDPYEPWVDEQRQSLRTLYLDLLRLCGRWSDVLAAEPADEDAHLRLIREHAAAGDRRSALRQFERMERALRHELGVAPSRAAIALRERLLAEGPDGSAPVRHPLVGRSRQLRVVEQLLGQAANGRGATALVTGPAGIGKSAFVSLVRDLAARQGWRSGSGAAAEIEGAWPYAPVLEALADMSRRHPTLLDGLDDTLRQEIDRALSGRELQWTRETAHQRLFVAASELLRIASSGNGALLVVEDLHEADEASLRLLHYLARTSHGDRVLLLLTYRSGRSVEALERMRSSLLTRKAAVELRLPPLEREDARALVERVNAELPTSTAEEVVELAGGVPYAVLELARQAGHRRPLAGSTAIVDVLPADTRSCLERVAVVGLTFGTDEFVAVAERPEAEAFEHLDTALDLGVLERSEAGYRFRHALARDALLERLPPHRQRVLHRGAAARLAELGASPARIGQHLLLAGEGEAAVPHVLRAAETAAAVGAYPDALKLLDSVRSYASGPAYARLLALRADVLAAIGNQEVLEAYREALREADETDRPLIRARMARAALTLGDVETAGAVLEGMEPDGGVADAALLLARGHVEWARGNVEQAWQTTDEARRRVASNDRNWQLLDLLALQGLIAHTRGQWFDRLRQELMRTRNAPKLAAAIFDSHLCIAEYLLYGPAPYAEVAELSRTLRTAAERAGALRAVAFASALSGEAALLAGDLEAAERGLTEAVDLHREIGASAGEAHSLQRLAELRLAQGNKEEADRLLRRALPLARWSSISLHLMQRVYGTLVQAAPSPEAARAVVDRAEAALGPQDKCYFCDIMLAVPAAIACAQVGDVADARRFLATAHAGQSRWEGTAWEAATLEAEGHVLRAEGDDAGARRRFARAAEIFSSVGQPLDVQRCQEALERPLPVQRLSELIPSSRS